MKKAIDNSNNFEYKIPVMLLVKIPKTHNTLPIHMTSDLNANLKITLIIWYLIKLACPLTLVHVFIITMTYIM